MNPPTATAEECSWQRASLVTAVAAADRGRAIKRETRAGKRGDGEELVRRRRLKEEARGRGNEQREGKKVRGKREGKRGTERDSKMRD